MSLQNYDKDAKQVAEEEEEAPKHRMERTQFNAKSDDNESCQNVYTVQDRNTSHKNNQTLGDEEDPPVG